MMVRCLTVVTVTLFAFNAVAADGPQVAPAEPEGMRSIFTGEDLTGWGGDPRLWSVKDGAIRGETTAENRANGNTFIMDCSHTAVAFPFGSTATWGLSAFPALSVSIRTAVPHVADAGS